MTKKNKIIAAVIPALYDPCATLATWSSQKIIL